MVVESRVYCPGTMTAHDWRPWAGDANRFKCERCKLNGAIATNGYDRIEVIK